MKGARQVRAADKIIKKKKVAEENFQNLENEEWKPVPNYDGFYDVSNLGRIRSVPRKSSSGGVLKPCLDGGGYPSVQLRGGNHDKPLYIQVHRLVAAAFIGPRPINLVVDHINRVKTNNTLQNLRYVTQSDNCKNREIRGGLSNITRICKTKTKDGEERIYEYQRFLVNITDRAGKRVTRTFKTREEADAALLQLRIEHKR